MFNVLSSLGWITERVRQEPIFYVYVLFRPWNGRPCYVGKGHGDRWLYHSQGRASHRNAYLKRILEKAVKLNLGIPRIKVRENLTEAEALETEVALIAAIGRKARGGPLANLTDGGEGTTGHHHSEEARAKIAAAGKGREFSATRRAKIGAAHKGMRHTEETKERIRLKKIGVSHAPPSSETRLKISAKLTGILFTPERLKNMSEGQRNSELRKKVHARLRGVPLTPETKEKLRRAMTGRKLTAEHRAKVGARSREMWAKRRQNTGVSNADLM